MAMDAKDLRIESALGAHSDDGNTKYAQSGTPFQTNGNKPYHDIASNSLAKMDAPTARPCAVIGPDRVVPPQSTNDAYVKKVSVEPWPCTDNIYQHPPEYPVKPTDFQHSRNISPRQTFQENMQRIMVPPSYASVKTNEDQSLKNPKLMSLEAKYCDVPYTISPINSEPKIIKNSEGLVLNNNSNQTVHPHSWANSGVNVRPLRPYGAPDLYQYSEYSNCPGPRPISMIRPHRNVHEDMPLVYQDRYHEANIRFKPYPATKERSLQNQHPRYDYIPTYPNTFQPHASYPSHKYELQKSIPTHPYSVYPPIHLKYLERRMPVPTMEKYPRSPSQQVNFNQPHCNQNIPSAYGTLPGNCLQNRVYPYPSDPSPKNMIQNRLYFDSNNARKYYTSTENMFINDINRTPNIKTDLVYSSYPPINIHSVPPHHMYRKESSMKAYEHAIHYRNIDYSTNINPLGRLPLQFSPQTMSISPSDSNTSIDTTHILGNAQDDCGYASQSSTASIRSIESGINRISHDIYRRHDVTLPHMNKFGQKLDTSTSSKDKKGLNVRQFLQMWNEGDEEGNDNKETTKQRDPGNSSSRYDSSNCQEQLYVLGLVNVPKEELGKYDHIQKISKLPENIKGYNSIELLNQYEKLVESPGLNHFSLTPTQPKQNPNRNGFPRHGMEVSNASARPLSPLDVEAKISQSVIHKEVGCNFEIRPCSPQMMNVELATPVHNVLGERLIEKVVNPVKRKSPICHRIEENNNITSSRNSPKVPSCKMATNQYTSPHVNDSIKTNYCLQDLESNSGVCLASLPRLDNDIELNFPEINQQFINDNKISSLRDLPILDTENGGNAHINKSKVHNQSYVIEHLNSGSDSDKDVSKLSKYRKQKRSSVPNDNDDTLNMSLHRTDSVIIKNPENAKSNEEYANNNNMSTIENIVSPVNVVAEIDKAINYSDKNKCGTVNENFREYKPEDSDTAIDFSLNKCDDIQSNSIINLNNLNDALQTNNEIDKNIYVNNETMNTDKHCSENLSKQLEEIAVSDSFPMVQPKSPTSNNITCSRVLNNNIVSQSIAEDTQVLQTHDSVIIHSKSKEITSDLVSASPITEEIITYNDLPSLDHDNENVPTDISACNSKIPENITALSNGIENEALNYCLTEHEDGITPICELKYNLLEENGKSHEVIKDIQVEDNCCSQLEENNKMSQETVPESDLQIHSDTAAKNDSVEDIAIQEPEDKEVQPMQLQSEGDNDIKNILLKNDHEESHLKRPSEQNMNLTSFKSEECISVTNECGNENHIEQLVTKDSVHCTKPHNSNDLTLISINEFDSTNISYTEMEVFKNDDTLSQITGNDIISDIKSNIPISPLLRNGNTSTKIKYDFTFNKELFSSRVQNLVIHNEGLCIPVKSNGHENTKEASYYSYRNGQSTQKLEDNLNNSTKPHSEEKTVNLEFGNNMESTGTNKSNNLTQFVENGITAAGSTLSDCDTNNIVTDLNKMQKNDILSNVVQDKILTETFVVENLDSKSLLEVSKEESNITGPVNNVDINDKINNHSKEKAAVDLLWNQLPSRRSRTLKRSLSESAVSKYTDAAIEMKDSYDNNLMCSRKRAKITDSEILVESQILTENFTNFIQNNRRNSVSTIYNDENVSFCIFIDNECVLAEENENCQKICYTEISDECLTTICTDEEALNSELPENISYVGTTEISRDDDTINSKLTGDIYYEEDTLICSKVDNIYSELDSQNISYEESEQCPYENNFISQNMEDRNFEETWVEDVACMETVFSDDIAEDIVISAPSSPKDLESSEDENGNTDFVYNIDGNEHTNKVKHIYGNQMCEDDAELVEKLYRTPQMNVNKTLIDRESRLSQEYNRCYDNESLEKILSESNTLDTYSLIQSDSELDKSLDLPITGTCDDVHGNKENLEDLCPEHESKNKMYSTVDFSDLVQSKLSEEEKAIEYDNCLVNSCESSCDNFVSYKKEEKLHYAISSSPEVSSTTPEEKSPAILLKIRSYKGSKISEVNEMSASFNHTHAQRPLITKAAQKYIPPLKETIRDLKVKIRLPKQSLYKLQELKKSKEKPKIDTSCSKLYIKSLPQENPKKLKPKPKFEDVLMSIDEIQFKKHKTKNKKSKQSVPKVIIKKNENGAHYASTQTNETFNPDLTGRKWQPWVFLEKSNFVDKMALKQKFKAIYSHRKKTFVLAEHFRKYKSISNAKFVISHPKSNDNVSTGKLKYTFRLKHS